METSVMFMDCPAYMDDKGTARCGLPADVQCRYTAGSTSGPLESAKIRCPRGHWFNGPVEFLTWGNGSRPASGSSLRECAPAGDDPGPAPPHPASA